jgi:uncharacterized damage-inducible protein DinB
MSTAVIDPRYPVGKFSRPDSLTPAERTEAIAIIESFPEKLAAAVKDWTDTQLDTPYREGGWTVRQLIHHIADSHMQAFARFRLGLTEDVPTIKAYAEKDWANLADMQAPPEISISLLRALHARWVLMLRSITGQQWQRTYIHPQNGETSLDQTLAMYAWHSRHHLAHITQSPAARAGSAI